MSGGLMLTRTQRILLAGYLAVCVVHLALLLAGQTGVARFSQAIAMPLLGLVLLAGSPGRGRLLPLVLIGLFFSWLGDVLPAIMPGAFALFTLIGAFAVAQLFYAVAFWPYRYRSLATTPWVLGYVLFVAVIIIACLPRAGVLLPAVIGYAAAIGVMAVLASGVHRFALVGALLFLVSDALIALNLFIPDFSLPAQSFWVMLTYFGAQLLLVLGAQAAADEEAYDDVLDSDGAGSGAIDEGSSNAPLGPA